MMYFIKKILALAIVIIICTSFQKTNSTVTIGMQTWMSRNYNLNTFRNGDVIPEVKSNEEWVRAANNKSPAWCYHNNDAANGAKYGKLYNWYAVNDPRGLAPEGWHVPSDEEWAELINYLGGEMLASKKIKSSTGWLDNCNGTNSSGFCGLPAAVRQPNGSFSGLGKSTGWWSSTEFDITYSCARRLFYHDCAPDNVMPCKNVDDMAMHKGYGFSIRCIKD